MNSFHDVLGNTQGEISPFSGGAGSLDRKNVRLVLENAADDVVAEFPHRRDFGDGVVTFGELVIRARLRHSRDFASCPHSRAGIVGEKQPAKQG
jgi:hypothetical protein